MKISFKTFQLRKVKKFFFFGNYFITSIRMFFISVLLNLNLDNEVIIYDKENIFFLSYLYLNSTILISIFAFYFYYDT